MTNKEMRELNEAEKELATKVLKSRIEELEHLKLLVEYNNFMLDKMLYSNYLEKRRGFEKQTKEYVDEIKDLEYNIEVTSEQINNGVEVFPEAIPELETPSMVG